MAKRATRIMPMGLVLHMGFAIWMLSNTNIVADEALQAALIRATDQAGASGTAIVDSIDSFDPGLDMSSRLFAGHVLPLTVLVFLLFALAIFWLVVCVCECCGLKG